MVTRSMVSRLQGWIHQWSNRNISTRAPTSRRPVARSAFRPHAFRQGKKTSSTAIIDVARFGLLSIATQPFSLWISIFSYDYFYRVDICRDALSKEDAEIAFVRSKPADDERPLIGRANQLTEVQALLTQPPHEIVVVAGTNESGKSRFVSEILRNTALERGIVYIQLAQMVDSLSTLTHALNKDDNDALRPVIVIDGLGEGSSWIRSAEGRQSLQRLIKWCIYITKERRLAHVILTGNEELVISLTDQNRTTRGHVKVIGLGDLSKEEVEQVVKQEIPDASPSEIEKIVEAFGGFVHDIQSVCREIQARLAHEFAAKDTTRRAEVFENVLSARFRLQMERIAAAFSKGKSPEDAETSCRSGKHDEDDELDPYLDPLKAAYSEAIAGQEDEETDEVSDSEASWTQLQLWQTVQRCSEAENMTVPFAGLRDDVFDGNITPLLELMNEDVLGFEVESSSAESGWSWEVKPATPALGRAFRNLVENSSLKERFQEMERVAISREKLKKIEEERKHLRRERQRMDLRKASLLKTAELGRELGARNDRKTGQELDSIFKEIVTEEIAMERRGIELREELRSLVEASTETDTELEVSASPSRKKSTTQQTTSQSHQSSIQSQLKEAILKAYVQQGSKDKFTRFRHAFEELTKAGGGIGAGDVVNLIKATSGEDVDLKAAEDFIRAWDVNADDQLSYDEFVTMLLTDRNVGLDIRSTTKDTKS